MDEKYPDGNYKYQIIDEEGFMSGPRHETKLITIIDNIKNRIDYPKQTNEYNALSDAKWNKKLYEFLKEE